ncbi:integrase, catalytic region, zinc finger, CCHC-type containing protein [Tanacetum coccineum]
MQEGKLVLMGEDRKSLNKEDAIEDSNTGMKAMLESGPWLIHNVPLILRKWTPMENVSKEDIKSVMVWVKLHDVSITAFTEDGLSVIATKLGTPLIASCLRSKLEFELTRWDKEEDENEVRDDDTFYNEDIDYVEASPPDSELVSLEEVKDLDTKDGEIDTDILLTIKDDILREKKKNSGSTNVHADISLSEYDSFHFEIEPDQGELTRVVVEDISDNSSRELYVHVPNVLPTLPTLEDRHYLFLIYVIRLFLPYFTSYSGFSFFFFLRESDGDLLFPHVSFPKSMIWGEIARFTETSCSVFCSSRSLDILDPWLAYIGI